MLHRALLLFRLPPDEPLVQRLLVCAVCLLVGAWMIFIGRLNVRARHAEETGGRALFLKMAGKSTAIRGRMATLTGWTRIVVGVAAIVFGFVFLFFGAFLK